MPFLGRSCPIQSHPSTQLGQIFPGPQMLCIPNSSFRTSHPSPRTSSQFCRPQAAAAKGKAAALTRFRQSCGWLQLASNLQTTKFNPRLSPFSMERYEPMISRASFIMLIGLALLGAANWSSQRDFVQWSQSLQPPHCPLTLGRV